MLIKMKNKPMFNTHIRIKQIREELGMTQKFVADKLGMYYANYSLLEQGKQNIKLETLIEFWNLIYERGYDMRLETLITGVERTGTAPKKRIKNLHSSK